MSARQLLFSGLCALGASFSSAAGQSEVITIQSGVDPVTYTGNLACCVPLTSEAFTAQDFADALAGPLAPVIPPVAGYWVETLSCGPSAQWISPGGTGDHIIGSGLFAAQFQVETDGDPVGTIELCWAADDRLGDSPGGPNEIGAYINGLPLSANFTGPTVYPGGTQEASAIQADVPLLTGTNTLHVYLRDVGSQVSGAIFSCRVQVGECGLIVPYCESTANSTGAPAQLALHGSLSVSSNQAILVASGCPPDSFGVFIYGRGQVQYPFGNGVLCINPFEPGLFRMLPGHLADASGSISHPIDFASLPPQGSILGGSNWNFQLFFRDIAAGAAGFNTSNALNVTFCP